MCVGHLYFMELLPFGRLGDRSWFVLLVLCDLVVPFRPRCSSYLSASDHRTDWPTIHLGNSASSNSFASMND